jgi:LysM repeat protein
MKKAAFGTLCLLLLLTIVPQDLSAQAVKHTLQKGETLYAVSRLYKVPYEALAAANGISDPAKVKVGTVLIIPSVHQVVKGETLYGLARQYGVSLGQLLSANKLNSSYVLHVGDILVVPAGSSAETPVEAAPAASAPVAPSASTSTTAVSPAGTASVKGSGTSSATSTKVTTTVPAKTTTSTLAPKVSTTTAAPPTVSPAATVPSNSGSSSTAVSVQGPQISAQPKQGSSGVPLPDPVKTQDRTVDASLKWPASGKAMYLDGKLEGVMIRVKPGETAKAIASGTVVSAGPSRGFSQVVFIQAKSGYVYVYGGIEALTVKTGDHLASGTDIGRIGVDAKDGAPIAYFFVFRNGQPIDPAAAPRD